MTQQVDWNASVAAGFGGLFVWLMERAVGIFGARMRKARQEGQGATEFAALGLKVDDLVRQVKGLNDETAEHNKSSAAFQARTDEAIETLKGRAERTEDAILRLAGGQVTELARRRRTGSVG